MQAVPVRLRFWLPLLSVVPLVLGCPEPDDPSSDDDDDPSGDPSTPADDPDAELVADIDVDANRDGTVDVADDADEDVFAAGRGAMFVANVDDDDNDGTRDSRDDRMDEDANLEDLAVVTLRAVKGLDGHAGVLTLSPDAAQAMVRVWRDEGGVRSVVLDPAAPQASVTLSGIDKAVTLYVEALTSRTKDWDGELDLTFALTKGGETVSEDRVHLTGAPLILPDNLQAPRTLFVMDIPDSSENNAAFVGAMRDALPSDVALRTLNRNSYGYDRWVQDNMELGYQLVPTATGTHEMRMAIQLQRGYGGGGLEDFVPNEYLAPGVGYLYPQGAESSHNYGGNLEVAPPVAGFPLGRILFGGGNGGTLLGRASNDTMNAEQVSFLNAQVVQAPALELSSEWLAVGHIDEIFQFVPDRNGEAGAFKVIIASPALARSVLLQLQDEGEGSALVFAGRRNQTTVDEILADADVLALNDAAQARIDTVQAKLIAELGLTEQDFLPVPVMYEDVGQGYVAALNPGIQNLVTVGDRLFAPDPEGPDQAGLDAWQTATLSSLASIDMDVIFVDVFESYHELLGEAHCGTNVDRAPYALKWWSL